MAATTGVRLTMTFNFAQQIRFSGWTESYDLGYADIPTAYNSITAITAFMSLRCQCLGIGPVLVEATLSGYVAPPTPGAPPPRRNTAAIPIPPYPAAQQAYNKNFINTHPKNFNADFAPTVLYMRATTNLATNPVYSRNIWIGGLPDDADSSDSAAIVEANTLAAVNAFIQALQNVGPNLASKNSVSLRSLDRSAGNPIKQCTAWNLVPNTYTVPSHGFVANQQIQAIGMRADVGGTCPRGYYRVGQVVDANTITLAGAGTPTPPKNTGGFRAVVHTWNTFSKVVPYGFTKHDRGGPFSRSVGRRKKRAIARA